MVVKKVNITTHIFVLSVPLSKNVLSDKHSKKYENVPSGHHIDNLE